MITPQPRFPDGDGIRICRPPLVCWPRQLLMLAADRNIHLRGNLRLANAASRRVKIFRWLREVHFSTGSRVRWRSCNVAATGNAGNAPKWRRDSRDVIRELTCTVIQAAWCRGHVSLGATGLLLQLSAMHREAAHDDEIWPWTEIIGSIARLWILRANRRDERGVFLKILCNVRRHSTGAV